MTDELYSDDNFKNLQRQDEERVAQQRAEAYGLPYLNLSIAPIQEGAIASLSSDIAREAGIAVIYRKGDAVKVAVKDPKNKKAQKVLEDLKKSYHSIFVVVVSHASLLDIWERYPVAQEQTGSITGYVTVPKGSLEKFRDRVRNISDVATLLSDISETNASQGFEALLGATLAFDATDIHIEPQHGTTDVRLKIDGILYEIAKIDEHLYNLLLSRIKLLSKLKLNVHDQPQEGRFSILFEDREIEVRTSILPSEYNEDIALRVLDPKFLLSLPELGLRADLEEIFKEELHQPQGFIVVTGPTGSGKTTTLYAGLNFLKEKELKIITIEDPIEYHLAGITQTQVSAEDNYTFESGLRAILRQDPDIVLLSELRSIDAADAAMQAALAGRMVLSTLHTIDASGTAPRLIDLGADPATVSSALSTTVAQRLVRRLCINCKKEGKIAEKEYELFAKLLQDPPLKTKIPPINPETTVYFASEKGCEVCRGTGYKGRIAIFEIVVATDAIKKKILENPTEEEMREFAKKEGMTSIIQDAVMRILEGTTSFEEVERVLGTLK